MKEQLKRYNAMNKIEDYLFDIRENKRTSIEIASIIDVQQKGITQENIEQYLSAIECNPKLVLNKDIDDFYKFTIEDINIENYRSLGVIKMPVSI